jgi:hypothetical protein
MDVEGRAWMEAGSGGNPTTVGPTPTAGEVIAAWKAGGRVYVAVRVPGDGPGGEDVEYVGSVSEEELAKLSREDQRQALLAVVRLERDRQRALAGVEMQGLVGPITL